MEEQKNGCSLLWQSVGLSVHFSGNASIGFSSSATMPLTFVYFGGIPQITIRTIAVEFCADNHSLYVFMYPRDLSEPDFFLHRRYEVGDCGLVGNISMKFGTLINVALRMNFNYFSDV